MNKFLVLAFLILALPFYVFAKVTYPDYKNYVNDFSSTLSSDTVSALNTKLKDYENTTTNQIAVVLVSTLDGEPIESYSIGLADKWKVGQKGQDNGVILLLAMSERKIRIEVGYGLEGDLTDAEAAAIARNIISPDFKQGKYNEGVTKGVDAVIGQLSGDPSASVGPLEANSNNSWYKNLTGIFGDFFWVILFVPTWLFSLMARSKSWYAGGIFGGIVGGAIALITSNVLNLLLWGVPMAIFGLVLDYFVSKGYQKYQDSGAVIPWYLGGGMGGSSSSDSGFGGFGGGGFGGGGGGGDW